MNDIRYPEQTTHAPHRDCQKILGVIKTANDPMLCIL